MSTKDIKMESIADLMWTEEDEVDPNGAVADLGINCSSGGGGGLGDLIAPPPRPAVLPKGCI